MPTVRYGPRKVSLDPLPGARLTGGETPESMGAGLAHAQGAAAQSAARGAAQKGNAMAGVGEQVAGIGLHTLSAIQEQERNRADDVALMSAKNQIARWEADRLYDPAQGALAQKGKSALALPEQVDGEYTKLTGDIEAGLNDRQRAQFQKIKGEAGVNIHATIQRHVFGEMQAYEKDELTARLETGNSLAIANAQDPRRVKDELSSMVEDFKKSAPRLGLGPEATAAGVADIQSKVHVGVIDRLLTAGTTTNGKLDAALYFEEAKSQIDGKMLEQVEKSLAVGTTRKDGQRAADQILAAGGTLTEQRQKAAAIENPAVRDDVTARLEHEYAVKKAAEGQATEDLLDHVYARIEKGADFSSITPSEQVQLGRHLPALRAEATRIAKGEPKETDPATYYALLQQATEDPASFAAKGNSLLTFSNRLDDSDLKRLMAIQMDLRAGKPAPKELDDYRSEAAVIADALSIAGIEPTPADKDTVGKERVARLHSLVSAEVRRVQEDTKKKISNADLEAITSRILAKSIRTAGWFGTTKTKPLSSATVADVPKAERTLIEEALSRHGEIVNDDRVLDVWMKHQIRSSGP